jgi:hypothetical protein
LIFNVFKHLKNINKITIDGCEKIDDNALMNLRRVSSITLINLKNITDIGLNYLTNVVKLTLTNIYGISNKGFINLNKLKKLILYNNYYLNNNINDSIFKCMSNLNYLGITNYNFTGDGFRYLPNLIRIYIHSCDNINIGHLFSLKYLKKIYMLFNKLITQNDINNIVDKKIKLSVTKCGIDNKLNYGKYRYA